MTKEEDEEIKDIEEDLKQDNQEEREALKEGNIKEAFKIVRKETFPDIDRLEQARKVKEEKESKRYETMTKSFQDDDEEIEELKSEAEEEKQAISEERAEEAEQKQEEKQLEAEKKEELSLASLYPSDTEPSQQSIKESIQEKKSEFEKEMKKQKRIGRQGKYDPIALREETKQRQTKELEKIKSAPEEKQVELYKEMAARELSRLQKKPGITREEEIAYINATPESEKTKELRQKASSIDTEAPGGFETHNFLMGRIYEEKKRIREAELAESTRLQEEQALRDIEKLRKQQTEAESLLGETRSKVAEIESKEKTISQKEAEISKQLESNEAIVSKSDRLLQLEKDLEIVEDSLTVSKKDPERYEQLLLEKSEIENQILSEKSIKESKPPIDQELESRGLVPIEESVETDREKRLRQNREQKDKDREDIRTGRKLRNEKQESLAEKSKLDLARSEVKLRKEEREEGRRLREANALKKLSDKQAKLKIKKDIVALRAQRISNRRTIQAKRKELLEKNLAFLATRGAYRKLREINKQKQQQTIDKMLTQKQESSDHLGPQYNETIVGLDVVPGEEEKFDLIKSLTGEEFGSSNDEVSKKIKLL